MAATRAGRLSDERGYLMVALLVAMSVMAIMMTAILPAWHTLARREKEAELIFRGEQYARAIGFWQRRFANQSPPSIDVLVEQRLLRKKYKDPITNDDFQIVGAGGALPGQVGPGASPAAQSSFQLGTSAAPGGAAAGRGSATTATFQLGQAVAGGIVGVTSKSTEKSLRLYNGRDTYNQWIFMPVAQAGRAGGPRGGGAGPEGRGGRGADGRGGRGVDGRGVDGRGVDGRGGRGADASGLDLNRGFEGFGRGGRGGGQSGARDGRGGQAPPPGR